MRTYVHLISFVWIWPCEKLFRIGFLLRSRDLKFEGIGSGSDFRERPELCLVFSFRLFSNTSVRRVCRRKGGKRTRSGVCLLRSSGLVDRTALVARSSTVTPFVCTSRCFPGFAVSRPPSPGASTYPHPPGLQVLLFLTTASSRYFMSLTVVECL
jgi:hypothetical protein